MKKISAIIDVILKAVGLSMGVAALVLSILGVAGADTLIILLAIGMFCLGVTALDQTNEEELEKL